MSRTMGQLMLDHGSVDRTTGVEKCEGCGSAVVAALCGDGTRLIVSMQDLAEELGLDGPPIWDACGEHTPESCRARR